MSAELSKEQLLDYVKKQKMRIKKLETDLQTALARESPAESESSDPVDVQSLKSQVSGLEADVAQKTTELSEMKAKLTKYAQAIKSKSKDIESKDQEIVQLQNRSAAVDESGKAGPSDEIQENLENENRILKSRISELDSILSILNDNLAGEVEKNKDAAGQIEQFRNLIKESQQSSAASAELSAANIEELTSTLKTIKDELTAVKYQAASEISSLNQQLDSTRTEIESLLTTSKGYTDLIAELEQANKSLASQLDNHSLSSSSIIATASANFDEANKALQLKLEAMDADNEEIRLGLAKGATDIAALLKKHFSMDFGDEDTANAPALDSLDNLMEWIPLVSLNVAAIKQKEERLLDDLDHHIGKSMKASSQLEENEKKIEELERNFSILQARSLEQEAQMKQWAQEDALSRSVIQDLKAQLTHATTPVPVASPAPVPVSAPTPAPAPAGKNNKKKGKGKSGKGGAAEAATAVEATDEVPPLAPDDISGAAALAAETPSLSLDPEIDFYRRQVLSLQEQVAHAADRLASFGDLPTQLQSYQGTVELLNKDKSLAEEQISKLRQDLEQSMAESKAEIQQLEKSVADAKAEIEQLELSVADAKAETKQSEQELGQSVAESSAAISDLQGRHDEAIARADAASEHVAQLETLLATAQSKVDALALEASQSTEGADLQEALGKISELTVQCEGAQQRLTVALTENGKLADSTAAMQVQAAAEVEELTASVAQLTLELKGAQGSLALLQRDAAADSDNAAANIAALESDKTRLEQQLAAALEAPPAVAAVAAAADDAEEDGQEAGTTGTPDLKTQLRAAQMNNKKLTMKLKNATTQLEKLKNQSANRVTKLAATDDENDDSSTAVGGTSQSATTAAAAVAVPLTELSNELAAVTAKLSDSQAAALKLIAQIESLEGALKETQGALADAEEDAASAREERERQRRRVLELEGELEEQAAAAQASSSSSSLSVGRDDAAAPPNVESDSSAVQELQARVSELEGLLAAAVAQAQDSATAIERVTELTAELAASEDRIKVAKGIIKSLREREGAGAGAAAAATASSLSSSSSTSDGDNSEAESSKIDTTGESKTADSEQGDVQSSPSADSTPSAESSSDSPSSEALAAALASLAAAEVEVQQLQSQVQTATAAAASAESQTAAHITELEQRLAAVQEEMQEQCSELAQKTQYLQVLRDELDSTVASVERGREQATSLQGVVDALTAEAEQTRTATATREKEFGEQIKQLDLTNKKLMIKLKSTMKEVNEAKALEKKLIEEKDELETSVRSTKLKLQDALDDAGAAREERERQRKRATDVEAQLENKTTEESRMRGEFERRCDTYKYQVEDLNRDNTRFASRIKALEKEVEETKIALDLAQGSSEAEERVAAMADSLSSANTRVAQLSTEVDTLQREKSESEAKVEVMADKVKRMKILLTKSKNLAQEREAEVVKLEQTGLRAMRFSIQSRISVAAIPDDPTATHWCLLYEDDLKSKAAEDGSGSETVHNLRWVEEHIVRRWLEDGSSLIGSWPEYLQDTWTRELSTMRKGLEEERDGFKTELADVTKNFSTYKARAQLALKRVGYEDRNERHKVLQAESEQITDLHATITDLEGRLKETESSLQEATTMHKQALDKVADLEEQIIALETNKAAETQKVEDLQMRVSELVAAATVASNRVLVTDGQTGLEFEASMDAGDTSANKTAQQEITTASFSATALRVADVVTATSAPVPITPIRAVAAHAESPAGFERALEASRRAGELMAEWDRAGPSDATTEDDDEVVVRSTREDGSYSKQTTKALLIQQYDSEIRDCITVLRDENSKLVVEIIEMRRSLALSDEQLAALKEALKEAQVALTREKEFNSSGQRINAEYLVNVLRKFLMTDNKSERARLVVAVTQILHLRPEESKIIAEKWAFKNTGIVGWFMPAQPESGEMPYDAFSDGVAGLNMYA